MAANQYTVLDPERDPSAVSVPPPQRKPNPSKPVKKATMATAGQTIATAPVGAGVVSPAAGDNHLATSDNYDDARMDRASATPADVLSEALTSARGPAGSPPADERSSAAAGSGRPGSGSLRFGPPSPPKRIRIQFETAAGVYSVPALSATPSRYGLMVMLPRDDNQASFVPAIGSTFTVGSGKDSWVCYFPGTEFDLDEPAAKVLVFIFAEGK